jgi:hypothetical protein
MIDEHVYDLFRKILIDKTKKKRKNTSSSGLMNI